jgi:integrase
MEMENIKCDVVELWLNHVAKKHSDSQNTRVVYKQRFEYFCGWVNTKPQDLINEFDSITTYEGEKGYRKKLERILNAYLLHLSGKYDANGTIRNYMAPVNSFLTFYKIGVKGEIVKDELKYHNRDITPTELKAIMEHSSLRDKTYFKMFAESGLRPHTLSQLKFKHLKVDYEANRVPCKIDIPKEIVKGKTKGHYTFIGSEALSLLKAYLEPRRDKATNIIDDEEYIFLPVRGTTRKAMTNSFSTIFRNTANRLGIRVKPSNNVNRGAKAEIRIYCLRKFFRNQAMAMGREVTHFMMGHTLDMNDEHYFSSENVEKLRNLYREKAYPNLRIYDTTVSQELVSETLAKDSIIKDLQMKMDRLQRGYDRLVEDLGYSYES